MIFLQNFVEQNPHWEIEWLKDREKALERVNRTKESDSDDEGSHKKKRKHKDSKHSPAHTTSKEKKRKKKSKKRRKHSSDSSSSSSSSDSSSEEEVDDKSRSIRVAMRNKMKMEDATSEQKWEALGRFVEEQRRKSSQPEPEKPKPVPDDKLINQWMTVKEPENDKDKYLLDSLKDRYVYLGYIASL